jgi:hypothetical protein
LTIGTIAIDTGESSPPNSTATFSRKSSSRAGDHALRRRRLVVAPHQLELPAEHAALGVQLVDRDLQAAGDGLAGARRLARKRGDQADLDGVLRRGAEGNEQRERQQYPTHSWISRSGAPSLAGRMPC